MIAELADPRGLGPLDGQQRIPKISKDEKLLAKIMDLYEVMVVLDDFLGSNRNN